MATIYAFGPFRLDAEAEMLFRGKEPVTLGRRAVALLRVLLEQPGAPVSKDALIDAAWPGLAVEENNLTVQVAALRRVFGEEPGGEHWIETLPRRGYRFTGPVPTTGEKVIATAQQTNALPPTTPPPTKILIVDDHVLIREALRGVLNDLAVGATILEAPDCRRAMQLIEEHSDLGLILLDLNLPDRDGFSVLAELRERFPAISIVVMSAMQDRDNVMKALEQGALGFIPKSATRDVMINALRLVFSGGMYIPPQILPS
jgi:DNA-binding response OmpR family regulator